MRIFYAGSKFQGYLSRFKSSFMGVQYQYISHNSINVLLKYFRQYFCVVLPSLMSRTIFGVTLAPNEQVLGLRKRQKFKYEIQMITCLIFRSIAHNYCQYYILKTLITIQGYIFHFKSSFKGLQYHYISKQSIYVLLEYFG